MSNLRIHMVGNAHLDPAWMWTCDEGMEAFLSTVRAALDRIDETPDFVFTCSSAAHYRWIEEVEPSLFERVREAVAAGRWSIVGGWWVQADCNIPSGEGFVRQALLGQRYFLDRFGLTAHTGYSPDAFGHNLGLPQLMSRAGLRNYIFCRPDPTELTLPSPLLEWRSPDGTSVLAYRVPLHYNMYETSVPNKVRDIAAAFNGASPLAADARELAAFGSEWCLFYGVGNHGGGPTREHIQQIIEINADRLSPELLFSTPDRFFNAVRADSERTIPIWRDDLQIDAPGCYTAHSQIKYLNRHCEHSLVVAEKLSSIAGVLLGVEYPSAELADAWEHVCFNHFHDIVCGVATREALDDAIEQYGAASAAAKHAARNAVQRVARAIDTTGDGQTLVVVNPHTWASNQIVHFEMWHDIDKRLWSQPVDIRVTDDAGIEIPSQLGFTSGKIGRDRIAVSFRSSLPALGWQCFRVHYGEKSSHHDAKAVRADASMLQNKHLRVSVDAATGAVRITSLAWHGERRICDGARAIVIADNTDTWGHGVERFDDVVGAFADAEVLLVESGSCYARLRVVTRFGASWMQQDFTLGADSDAVDVDVKIMWTEQHRMLKLAFATSIDDAMSYAESAYAVTPQPCDARERPCGTWCAVAPRVDGNTATRAEDAGSGNATSDRSAFAIVSDAKHGYSCDIVDGRAELRLSILRSPSYATHDPHPFDANEDLDFLDQGVQRFRYRIVPLSDGLDTARLTREGAMLCAPVISHLESAHAASSPALERAYEAIAVEPSTVIASVLKRSEDGDGWIVRLYEAGGVDAHATIDMRLLGLRWAFDIGAGEVRTFRVTSGVATEVDLVERDNRKGVFPA